ncbi:MAG: hypothetical protein O7H41_16160 [Planctomycetota bacterium]|nr:hypothetical protein [Planctomycetota bacterium]
MFWTRPLQPLILIAIITVATGCQTTVGNYLGNRGRDLGECFTIQAALGVGLAVEAKLAGVAHVCVGAGGPVLPLGFEYGRFNPPRIYDIVPFHSAYAGLPVSFLLGPKSHTGTRLYPLHLSSDFPRNEEHSCYWLLPGLFSFQRDVKWIWGSQGSTWARIHAFDIEAGVFVGIIGVRAGFSPGEFVDFLLGWFGVDIAGDDVRVKSR